MTARSFVDVTAMRLERDGSVTIGFANGRIATGKLDRDVFGPTSAIAASTYFPQSSRLRLQTIGGHNIIVELPDTTDLAPLDGRPAIYLDQNHWSTLTNAIYQPERVSDKTELEAATHLVGLVTCRTVVLPMSSAHMSETCKQVDIEQRYYRALTLAQLSAGWQLRDPLDIRRFELRQALTTRYLQHCLLPPAAVTLEPNAVHAGRDTSLRAVDADLPEDARWAVYAISCIGGILDTMLDDEQVPMEPVPGWAAQFQDFATFLTENPTGSGMRRRRTHAKFIADLGRDLPEAAHLAGVTPEQMSDWAVRHSEDDLRHMPALGLFREVLHEKLCDKQLQWEDNDLVDMMYLTGAAGYCDHVVAERAHTSHMANGLRRLGRTINVHRNIRTLMERL